MSSRINRRKVILVTVIPAYTCILCISLRTTSWFYHFFCVFMSQYWNYFLFCNNSRTLRTVASLCETSCCTSWVYRFIYNWTMTFRRYRYRSCLFTNRTNLCFISIFCTCWKLRFRIWIFLPSMLTCRSDILCLCGITSFSLTSISHNSFLCTSRLFCHFTVIP